MLPFFLACAAPEPEPLASAEAGAPSDWFYADHDGSIDWDSVAIDGELSFHTVGDGLESGPVTRSEAWSGPLACGAATTRTLAFLDGELDAAATWPHAPCVEARAFDLEWEGLRLDDRAVADTFHALVVLDVDEEDACSSC
jgi:hypothetical protein